MAIQNSVNQFLTMVSGAISLPGVKYARANVNSSINGNNDSYTVPTGKRALVLFSNFRSQSASTATLIQNWKISGTYYNTTFSAISLTTGAVANDTADGGFVMEAGESISYNSNQTTINIFTQIVEFDNTAALKTVKTIGATNGDQTIYTVPAGKKAILVSGNGQPLGSGNQGFFISNNSGGSITSNIYLVPSGGSKGTSNLFRGSISTANGAATRLNCGAVLSAGDFIVWNCGTTNANALCAVTLVEM